MASSIVDTLDLREASASSCVGISAFGIIYWCDHMEHIPGIMYRGQMGAGAQLHGSDDMTSTWGIFSQPFGVDVAVDQSLGPVQCFT